MSERPVEPYAKDEVEAKRGLIDVFKPRPNANICVSADSACSEARWLATLDARDARIARVVALLKEAREHAHGCLSRYGYGDDEGHYGC